MADVTFVSRRDSSFREFPPASAHLAVVLAFYGELTVWVRKPGSAGWHLPTSGRRSRETIVEVDRRELWESARVLASRLDLLGAITQDLPKPSTGYVYMCDVQHLPWSYELPQGVDEVGVFKVPPAQTGSEWSQTVLDHAVRARRLGLR